MEADEEHLFVCFCEVSRPYNGVHPPSILVKYPDDFEERDILGILPKFTYPCEIESTAVEQFSFVMLKDLKRLHGFCRHSPQDVTAIVLLSFLPWHDVFFKLLDRLRQVAAEHSGAMLRACLQMLYHTPVPDDGSFLHVILPDGRAFHAVCPDRDNLPAVLQDRNLTELWSVVDAAAVVEVFTALLNERHVLITAARVSRFSACVQAVEQLLHPLHWQHIFLPVVPEGQHGCLSCPVPFLAGAPTAMVARLAETELIEGCVLLEVDTGTVRTLGIAQPDLCGLPADVESTLRRRLKIRAPGDGVSRAFRAAVCELVDGYRRGVRVPVDGGRPTFDSAAFLCGQPSGRRPFLSVLVKTQMFQQFIEERLGRLPDDSGPPPPHRRPAGLPWLCVSLCGSRRSFGRRRRRASARSAPAEPPPARSVPSSPSPLLPAARGRAGGRGVVFPVSPNCEPWAAGSSSLLSDSSLMDEIEAELQERRQANPATVTQPPSESREVPIPAPRRRRGTVSGGAATTCCNGQPPSDGAAFTRPAACRPLGGVDGGGPGRLGWDRPSAPSGRPRPGPTGAPTKPALPLPAAGLRLRHAVCTGVTLQAPD